MITFKCLENQQKRKREKFNLITSWTENFIVFMWTQQAKYLKLIGCNDQNVNTNKIRNAYSHNLKFFLKVGQSFFLKIKVSSIILETIRRWEWNQIPPLSVGCCWHWSQSLWSGQPSIRREKNQSVQTGANLGGVAGGGVGDGGFNALPTLRVPLLYYFEISIFGWQTLKVL